MFYCRLLTGAWIETLAFVMEIEGVSRLLTGAWIETVYLRSVSVAELVASLRGRGLKLA